MFFNLFKKGYFIIIFKKILKRFEKDNSKLASEWAKKNCRIDTDEYCKSIDPNLWNETKYECNKILNEGNKILEKFSHSLGGAGNFFLLYFFVRKFKPAIVIETGVAAGWSSVAILRAFKKNNFGKLFSSDFPYFRLKNPEKFIGVLVKNENNKDRWQLDVRGDEIAIPNFLNKIGNLNIDLVHYDSDKSYSGREFVLNKISKNLGKNSIIIFDDIQNNLHFKDYVTKYNSNYTVMQFKKKYLGIINL